MRNRILFLLLAACLPILAQLPRIEQLQNNYSYLLPDNPSYGIAQGSIFIIKGTNLAPSATSLQSIPLATSLNGVSARVTVNGVATDVLWYYVTPNQLGGILPSRTPVGSGTITVSTAAGTSAPATIKVVQSAVGVLTLSGTGTGTAAVFDAANNFLSDQNATKAGDIIQLFGTGVGPASGDESREQTQTNLTSIPMTADVGGKPATILYRGRTIYPGLDQVNIVIPSGVTPGCGVPLTLRTGAFVSNVTTLPIGNGGRTCPSNPGLEISQSEINAWLAAGEYRIGSLGLTRQTSYSVVDSPTGGTPTTIISRSDIFSAGFQRITGPDLPKLLSGNVAGPAAGSCLFYDGSPVNPFPNLTYTSLDAGELVSAGGPAGTRSALRTRNSVGMIQYSATIGTGAAGNFLDPGQYTFTGPGGPDVGAFSGSIPIAPELLWTNRASFAVVTISQPLTLTWSGGEPTTLVTISGTSTVPQGTTASVTSFQCVAKNTDGQFTVPANILSRMLPSPRLAGGFLLRGSLAIGSVGTGTRMQASGVDYLTAGNQWGVAQAVEYK